MGIRSSPQKPARARELQYLPRDYSRSVTGVA